MTLVEAIKHCEEIAHEKCIESAECVSVSDFENAEACYECGEYHKQLALWLTELKHRRETEIIEPPKSNADRIRQMTDEELAKILCFADCEVLCPANHEHCNGDCCGHFLRWLKQEVSEDAGSIHAE